MLNFTTDSWNYFGTRAKYAMAFIEVLKLIILIRSNNFTTIYILNFSSQHLACSLVCFSYVNSVEFHPSGTCIAAGGTDSTVKVC